MFKLLAFSLTLLSLSAFSKTLEAEISSIDYPRNGEELTLLLLTDGSVVKLPPKNQKDLWFYEKAQDSNSTVRFEVDSKRFITSAQTVDRKVTAERISGTNKDSYRPTVLESMSEASRIFSSLRPGARSSSQCYNRAHVWAFESNYHNKLNSMKVFMFYTRRYIREYNFEWWFHVAPFTYVNVNGSPVEKVLDFKFARGPISMKPWTDIFMRNNATCPVIQKYSEYESNQEAEYCYLYKANMYYVQPIDLANLERTGRTRTRFETGELRRAYRNGFGILWY